MKHDEYHRQFADRVVVVEGEVRRWEIAQGAVGSDAIVVVPPAFDRVPRIP